MPSTPLYSVVVPVYNSELLLEQLNKALLEEMTKISSAFEVIYVEDGSKDLSWKVIEKLWNKNPDYIRAIKLKKNYGQYSALYKGISIAQGNWIITIDDDLQIHPREIRHLINTQVKTQSDLVYGTFPFHSNQRIKRLVSLLPQWLIKGSFNSKERITSFRIFKRDLAQKTVRYISIKKLTSFGILKYATKISYINVPRLRAREVGKTSYSFFKRFDFFSDILSLSPLFLWIICLTIISWIVFFITFRVEHLFKHSFTSLFCLSITFFLTYPVLKFLYLIRSKDVIEDEKRL